MKVNAQHVMALRRLTRAPVSACRDALIEAGGDLLAVIRKLRRHPYFGICIADDELSAILAEIGIEYPTRK